MQLEEYICNARLGILKIRHIPDNTTSKHVINLDVVSGVKLIEKYIRQTLLPYLYGKIDSQKEEIDHE